MHGDFAGTGRFRVLGKLGSGGMGSVYHVVDRERGTRLALKAVGRVEGDALLRFKREFRAAQGLSHPNLVTLRELFSEEGRWFYTMDLIDGVNFLKYVRPHLDGKTRFEARTETNVGAHGKGAPRERPRPSDEELSTPNTATGVGKSDVRSQTPNRPSRPAPRATFDEARLRAALAQLVDGISALHREGKVHRDIKPSNVLVTPRGRVVVLDFGLITDLHRTKGIQKSDIGIMGTYPYMSPEQASGKPVDARTDWYSMGVMLFQALTGRLPFPGRTIADMAEKVRREAPEPADLVEDLPEDLNALCAGLLRRIPEERPTNEEILKRTRAGADPKALVSQSREIELDRGVFFVGRERELDRLRACFSRMLGHETVSALLTGESGIGKSELLARFLDDVEAAHPGVVVLRGRCYERESVPFKSIDGVVDSLSSHLTHVGDSTVRRLIPPHAELLARTFPVLRRVEPLSSVSVTAAEIPDAQEQRARVFSALRTLLSRLAGRDPVVMVVEDLQWLDEDSRSLLDEVLREPGAPPLFFLGTLRTDHGADEPARIADRVLGQAQPEIIHIGRLDENDAIILAEQLLEGREMEAGARAEDIAAEAEGHPLFIDELVRHAEIEGEPQATVTLDEAITARASRLEPSDQRLIEVLAVSQGPLPARVLADAADVAFADLHGRMNALRRERWVRSTGTEAHDLVEPYHARLAESVRLGIDEDRKRAIHSRLSRALELGGMASDVQLATHWAGAGEGYKAAVHALRAAEQAVNALAFDRAARLYRMSIELHPASDAILEGRQEKLARALSNAGRGLEAGETFLEAAEGRRRADAVDLRRLAAEQFLLSGHVKRGIDAFREVLDAVKVNYPESTLRTLLSITRVQVLLLLRRFRFEERDESMAPPEARLRVDACHSAALGFTPTDTMRGFDFYGRALLYALRLGEPSRVAIHMAMEATRIATVGNKPRRKTFRILNTARSLAERSGSARARGVVSYSQGLASYMVGEWGGAIRNLDAAEKVFREECSEAPELRTLQACVIHCLWESGEWKRLSHRTSEAIKEAMDRGDLFTEATIRAGLNVEVMLMRDEADRGVAMAEETIGTWAGTGFDVQRYMHWLHVSMAEAYAGRCEAARERLEASWKEAKRSLLFRVQLMRAGAWQIRGILTLQCAARAHGPRERTALAKIGRGHGRRLGSEDSPWCRAGGYLLEASAEALMGQKGEAAATLDFALRELDYTGMKGRWAAALWSKGALLGGDHGARMVAEAHRFFTEQGVKRPSAFAPTLAPMLLASDLLEIPLEQAALLARERG